MAEIFRSENGKKRDKNGNNIYAKTYVPAVYVSGLEAYFKNQH